MCVLKEYILKHHVVSYASAYHGASTLHIVEVSVSMCTEVHASGDPRERAAIFLPKATIWSSVFMFHLRNKVFNVETFSSVC